MWRALACLIAISGCDYVFRIDEFPTPSTDAAVSDTRTHDDGTPAMPCTFQPGVPIAQVGAPSFVRTGALDTSGTVGLFVASHSGNTVSVFLVSGGTLNLMSSVVTGTGPVWLALADVTGDAKLDLLVCEDLATQVEVFAGKGGGTFGVLSTFGDVTSSSPSSIAVADYTGDGKLDLEIAHSAEAGIEIAPGDGSGTFMQTSLVVSPSSKWMTASDFDGDGYADIALADSSVDQVTVIERGPGSISSTDYPVGGAPRAVVAGDLDGDQRLDLVVATAASRVTALLDKVTGFAPLAPVPTGAGPVAVAVADVNADQMLDAITLNSDNTVSVLLGNGDGSFAPHQDIATGGTGAASLAVTDFDGDGHPDLIVANTSSNTVTALLCR